MLQRSPSVTIGHMPSDHIVEQIADFLSFRPSADARIREADARRDSSHERRLVRVVSDETDIPAYLFVPDGDGPFPAAVVFHQHAGERHIGKSEVTGLAGDPLQAFGPRLAALGFVVLAPDSIAFEDRRLGRSGLEADEEADWLEHFNEMTYRIVQGRMLMTDVLNEAAIMVSALTSLPNVLPDRIGVLGHSYGGNTALFHAALDRRVRWTVASGAACTFRRKMDNGTGLEFALVMPGFVERWDIDDVVRCIAPRSLLIVSADGDKYSADAREILDSVQDRWPNGDGRPRIEHLRFEGGHALTQERVDRITDWIVSVSEAASG